MSYSDMSDGLKRARRALDGLPAVTILQDWTWDDATSVWYLRINIKMDKCTDYIPASTNWYVLVKDTYPKGKIKIMPDAVCGISVTLQHQSNNSSLESNGLWRKGALCVDLNTGCMDRLQESFEPRDEDNRLFWHIQRAIYWIDAAMTDSLVHEGDPFELPDFAETVSTEIFAFSEDVVTL